MVSCIKKVAKNILGKLMGTTQYKEVSWWNEKVKKVTKIK